MGMVCSLIVLLIPLPFRTLQILLMMLIILLIVVVNTKMFINKFMLALVTLHLMTKKKPHSIRLLLRVGVFMSMEQIHLGRVPTVLLLLLLTVNKQLHQFLIGLNLFLLRKMWQNILIVKETSIMFSVLNSSMVMTYPLMVCSLVWMMPLLT